MESKISFEFLQICSQDRPASRQLTLKAKQIYSIFKLTEEVVAIQVRPKDKLTKTISQNKQTHNDTN